MINLSRCMFCGALATVENRGRVYNGVRIAESCCLATIEEDIDCPNCGQLTQPMPREEAAEDAPEHRAD